MTSELQNTECLKPEWLQVKTAVQVFGLTRSEIYNLIKTNTIKSRLVKKRGNVSGRRLVSFDSLNDYIEGQPS